MQKYKALLVREQLPKPFEAVVNQSCNSALQCYQILKLLQADTEPEEHLWCIHLSSGNRIIGVTEVAIGCRSSAPVEPSAIFRTAILAGSASIVLAHNHPSGNCTPSTEDIESTKKIQDCGEILGIPLLDHIIISENGFCSIEVEED